MTFKLTLEKNYGKDREEKRKLGRINCCICGLENSLNFQFLAAKDKLISEDTKKVNLTSYFQITNSLGKFVKLQHS